MMTTRKWTGRRMLPVFFVLSLMAGLLEGYGQNSMLVNQSYDPVADSLFFKEMQERMAKIRRTQHRPTVALALAGGGARGTAHIGVLQYLEEKGIPVDFVVGTSMGGLMGGLYSLGYSVHEIDSLIRGIDWNVMMSDEIPAEYYSYDQKRYKSTYLLDFPFDRKKFVKSLPSGIKYGLNIYNLMSSKTVDYQGKIDFADLPLPFCCVATEIVTQTEKHWSSGDLISALRSTMSIPGYFRPVRVDSMILSDGGTKNNFPADVAKAAGADVIIGVELYMPRDYDEVNNIAEVLMQTTQYSGSLEAHKRNVQYSTIYVTPNLAGYGSLSFSTEEIDKMIRIGYAAAAQHEREFDSLADIVGHGGRVLQSPKAIDLATTKVLISKVRFDGLSDKEMNYFKDKLRIVPGTRYGKHEIEIAQSVIYSTMAFSQVTYELVADSTGEGYSLVYDCVKRPINALGIGIRADTEEWMAILLNGGFGRNRIFGPRLDVTARFSISPYLRLDFCYIPVRGPMFGIALKSQYRTLNGAFSFDFDGIGDDPDAEYEPAQYYQKTWRNVLDIYGADTHWSRLDLRVGFRLEHTPYYNIFSTFGLVKGWDWANFHPYLYFRLTFDNQSDRYFPDKGLRVTASYDYKPVNTHYAAASIQGTIPVCRFFHIIPSLRGRYILGHADGNDYMYNFVGGVLEGRYFDHQMPFIGFNGSTNCQDFLTMVDVDFRFKVYKNLYLSLVGAAMHDGNVNGMSEHAIYAAGLKVAYKSKIGPIQANAHWNSKNKKRVGFYVGVGYDF
ncbi:MAG: patatin-like phospholipase family protein [Bacteroidales bacterium]|nr:patatin-like phospholipase family protein [Bacteroidales bacterium]